MTRYLVYTDDQYELTLAVCDKKVDVAAFIGVDRSAVTTAMRRGSHLSMGGRRHEWVRIREIEMEDESDEGV